jgi:hypothetical protein
MAIASAESSPATAWSFVVVIEVEVSDGTGSSCRGSVCCDSDTTTGTMSASNSAATPPSLAFAAVTAVFVMISESGSIAM